MNLRALGLLSLLGMLVFAGACSSSDSGPTQVETGNQIAINAGNNQTAQVSTAVTSPPSVVVRDASSNPVAGVAVSFSVTGGGGTIAGASATTDANGIAAVASWTLGATAGVNTLRASSAGATGSPVSFTATAVAAPPRTIASNIGDAQTATVGTAVGVPPSVIVKEGNSPLSGVTVTFAVGNGGGSVSGASAVTNAAGIATVGSWTLGASAGANTLTASATGFTGSPVTFSATATAPTLVGTWNGLTGTQALSLTLVVNGSTVTGNGTLSNTPTGIRALTVTGTFSNPILTATLSSGSTQPFNITSTLNGNVLSGTLAGSGFNGNAVVLNRSGSTVADAAAWTGTYDIISVDGNAIPAVSFVSILGYRTTVTSRTLVVNADGTGSWADVSTSSLYCSPVTMNGPQCDSGGTATVFWAVSGSSLSAVRSTNTGYVLSSMTFVKQPDGTLRKTDNSATEVYRRRP